MYMWYDLHHDIYNISYIAYNLGIVNLIFHQAFMNYLRVQYRAHEPFVCI